MFNIFSAFIPSLLDLSTLLSTGQLSIFDEKLHFGLHVYNEWMRKEAG